jgi:hypothetical protein
MPPDSAVSMTPRDSSQHRGKRNHSKKNYINIVTYTVVTRKLKIKGELWRFSHIDSVYTKPYAKRPQVVNLGPRGDCLLKKNRLENLVTLSLLNCNAMKIYLGHDSVPANKKSLLQ